jgi:TldD protein
MYEDLVLYAVKYAESLGAKYGEARYHRIISNTIISRNGLVIGAGKGVSEGIGVRVLVDGALAFASTDKLDKESIRLVVEKAYSMAKAQSRLMKKPIEFADARMGRAKYSVVEKKSFDSLSIDEKTRLHNELWGIVSKSVSEAKVPVFFLNYIERIEEKVIANTDGAFIVSRIPRLSIMYNVVVSHPQKGTIQRFEQLGGSGGLEWLGEWRLDESLERDVKTYEKILLTAKEPPREPVDVIVGSEIVGLIVHESCGHPSEADRILGREAAQAGKSFIKPGMIGERIGNEYATVIDDPTIPGSYGFYLYDDEGVPARPRYLYKEGIIYEHLHNRWTAKVYGVESNAAARSMDYKSEPIIRMANTYFKPGDHSFEELVEDVEKGVYLKSYMEWNIDDERWSQRYTGLEAYLIENGELKGFVRNPVLEITTKAFYSSIDAVGKDLRFYAGICGKGEPAQGVPVWFGGPDLRLRNIRLGVSV